MAAPIQRYGDPRLYGTVLVDPFVQSYEWIRTIANPLHPKESVIMRIAIDTMKGLTGTFALVLTALPALVGRVVQIMHYHLIPKEIRLRPPEVTVQGMQLPQLKHCEKPGYRSHADSFHGTTEKAAISILRWGFDLRQTRAGGKIGEAVYISAADWVSAKYGENQLILSLDLKDEEVAYLSEEAWIKFNDSRGMAAVRELFLKNGYRAIRFWLNDGSRDLEREEAWAIYDPTCIKILSIRGSPMALPRLRKIVQPQLIAC